MHLYEHQKKAIERLRSGSILCGGVGTGKSLTALAYYYIKECGGEIDPEWKPMRHEKQLYIITTARKRDTKDWQLEMLPFLIDESLVRVDSWNNIGKYTDVFGAFFIFDEQRVVGSGAWVKAFYKITKKNRWILLSATPGDTWIDYIPVFVANNFYSSKSDFIRKHVVYSRYYTKYPKIDRYIEQGILERHRKDILVMMTYQKHTEQIRHQISAEYDKNKTKEVFKTRWDIYNDEPIQDAGGLCRVLRRIANEDPSRCERVMDIYRRHHKAIVFYNFDYELELLRKFCDENQIAYSEWNGHKHEQIPNGNDWLYLVQYTAGSEGWNCVETDTIIFYSQSYSYKTMVQAAGRTDRLNTSYNELHNYYICSKSPIDLAIARALSQKKDFNESGFASQKKQR